MLDFFFSKKRSKKKNLRGMLTPAELDKLLDDYDELKKQVKNLKKELAKYRFEKQYLLVFIMQRGEI